MGLSWRNVWGMGITEEARIRQESILKLQTALLDATTYEQWLEAAEELDRLLGNEEWKEDSQSDLFDSELVQYRTSQLKRAIALKDNSMLLHLIRTTLERNLGNMGDPRLYHYCKTGTKLVIEEYYKTCEEAIELLVDGPSDEKAQMMNTFIQARRAFGRTALLLSGGSTFGTLHIGVLRELFSKNLLPRVISGSSAGSIFASILAAHTDAELDEVMDLTDTEHFEVFEETGREESVLDRLSHFLKNGTWYDIKYLSNTMREMLGDLTFQEAYYRTGRILNVTVSSSGNYEMPKLLNYLTAPHVLLWSAVCASCSLPLIFASHDIQYKDPKTGEFLSWTPSSFIDGSVYSDLPHARLSEMFNVNHFIVCQVNPHVAPLVQFATNFNASAHEKKQEQQQKRMIDKYLSGSAGNAIAGETALSQLQLFAKSEISHFFHMLSELGVFPNVTSKMYSMFSQDYSGDITILPQTKWNEAGQLFKNPTHEFLIKTQLRGAQATWPVISLIRNRCTIELALDRAVHTLRGQLISHGGSDETTSLLSRKSTTAIRDTQPTLEPSYRLHVRHASEEFRSLRRKKSWTEGKMTRSGLSPSSSKHRLHMSTSSHNIPVRYNVNKML